MKTNKRLSVHHVGGRSGSRAFPVLSRFEKDIINVLYDADTDSLAQIQERNQRFESELHVLPYCLGDSCKSTSFYINYDPYTSSLRELNPAYSSYYCFYGDHDYVLSEVIKTMEERQVEIVNLDHIFQERDLSLPPPPDFLSIDTQGSEYEILQGAKEILKSNVLALVLEVEFHPMYQGQKLFGDVTKLLSTQGFDFVKFLDIQEFSPFRAAVGLRGQGFQLAADALYFRRIDSIGNDDKIDSYIMLRKLAFMAIVFNQFEFGLQCLKRSKELNVNSMDAFASENVSYENFLNDFEAEAARLPVVWPKTFSSKYTFESSKARFEATASKTNKRNSKSNAINLLKRLIKKTPLINHTINYTRQKIRHSKSKYGLQNHSEVEQVLISYGLVSQTKILKATRKNQLQFSEKS